jgi:hypothetical protein
LRAGVLPVTAVRCPKCGTVSPDGGRRLARCASCHEALGKCRYCLHYDPRQLDCTHLARATHERILDADEMLNCLQFTTGLTLARRRSILPFLRTAVVGLAVGLALMFGLSHLVAPKPPPEITFRISLGAPNTVFGEDPIEIKVFVLNQSDKPAEDVRVFIAGRSMRQLTCQAVEPPDSFEDATPQRVTAYLGELPPGEIGSVLLRFTSSRTGKLDLAAYVTAANLPVPDKTPIDCEVMP